MKQNVDIGLYLDEFKSVIAKMEESIKDLTDENSRLNRRVEAFSAENRRLRSDNSDLRQRLSKYGLAQQAILQKNGYRTDRFL